VRVSIFHERARARKERIKNRLQWDNFPEGDRPLMRASNIHFELSVRDVVTFACLRPSCEAGGRIPRSDSADARFPVPVQSAI
jgi:hypothetical protein